MIYKQRKKITFIVLLASVIMLAMLLSSCGSSDKDAAAKTYTADDLKNARISVVLGSNEDSLLKENYPDAEIMEFNSATDALASLRSKKCDFFVIQNSILEITERNTPDVKDARIELFASDNGFGFKKGRTELVEQVNGKIKEYQENGRLDEMASHWADVNNYVVEDVPENTEGETIVVGTTGELEPLNFYMNNKLVGLDIEIIGNILYDLGYQVEYKCMAFGALIPALESGKIDILASSMDISEERLKRIDISDPYFCEYISFAYLDTAEEETGFLDKLKEGLYDNLVKEDRYVMIIEGLKMTAALALTSGIFGTILGILLCLMKRSRFRLLRGIRSVYSAIIEGTPMVVILMIVCYIILGSVDVNGVIVGMLAFGMVFANAVCEAIENGLNNVDRGQYEAIAALGYPKSLGFRKIVMPQLMHNFLPAYRRGFVTMIKATAIAGYVAIQDLTKAGDIIRSRTFDAFVPLIIVAIIYFVIVWLVTIILRYIERSGARKRRKREIKL